MIPSSKVAELLDKNRKLMDTLAGQNLTHFALIVPPEGEAIEMVSMGSHADSRSFYTMLADKLKAVLESNQYGGVTMPRGIR